MGLVKSDTEAVTWLVSAGVSGFVFLCAVAFLYEKTRKKFEHPKLGRLVYEWGVWSGHLSRRGESVRFSLPGPKTGPTPAHCQALWDYWGEIESRVEQARPAALEELQDIAEEYEVDHIVEESTTEPGGFEKHWKLVGLEYAQDEPYTWCLEFEVSWDPEHTRAAYFDSAHALQGYGLSCAAPLDDED